MPVETSESRPVVLPVVGSFFKYRWTKRRFLSGRVFGLAQLLAIDETRGVAHTRILSSDDDLDDPVSIAFLPIVVSKLEASILEQLEAIPVPPSHFWPALAEWRELNSTGEAAAFGVHLFEAVELVWETIRSENPEGSESNLFVEYAYPVRSEDGRYSSVRAAARHR